jgi:two-component system sensor histidine kinase MprB
MGIAAGVAVALAVVAVAVSAYEGTRSQLTGQLDQQLKDRFGAVLHHDGRGGRFQPQGGPPGGGRPAGVGFGGGGGEPLCVRDEGLGLDQPPNPEFGQAPGTILLVTRCGSAFSPPTQTYNLPADARMKALARTGSGSYFTDLTAGSVSLRAYVQGIGRYGALAIALPLTSVNNTLGNELLLMAIIAAAGIALAALLAVLVSRTALAPIARFTRQTEAIAAEPQKLESERLHVSGDDELARLGRTFNATLDALEQSLQAQRNLVADASHELRTPIASIRANLQLLRDESRLSDADRVALREDMIEELDELTALVGDVVELARGSRPTGATGDVRLDEIVDSLIERTRRRAPDLMIEARIEPTLVRGEADRIARAVNNVLDNARKWSTSGGAIEVELRDGVVSVRDHGPGFPERDLPYVFDRFHRAKDARSKPGSGLGLAIVRQAAEAHGGYARAGNAAGGGAVVTVSFGPPVAIDAGAGLAAGPPGNASAATPERAPG